MTKRAKAQARRIKQATASAAPRTILARMDRDLASGRRVSSYSEAEGAADDALLASIASHGAPRADFPYDELLTRINSPAGDDPLLVFKGPMTSEQILEQLKALQEKARRGPIR